MSAVDFPRFSGPSPHTVKGITQAPKFMDLFTDVTQPCPEQDGGQGALGFARVHLMALVLLHGKLGTESCLQVLLLKQQSGSHISKEEQKNGREERRLGFGG